jgi:hypothetical protein
MHKARYQTIRRNPPKLRTKTGCPYLRRTSGLEYVTDTSKRAICGGGGDKFERVYALQPDPRLYR